MKGCKDIFQYIKHFNCSIFHIGYGASAIVYGAMYKPLNKKVAVKMIDLDFFERNQIDEVRVLYIYHNQPSAFHSIEPASIISFLLHCIIILERNTINVSFETRERVARLWLVCK
jgi:hypothetical protein